MKNTVGTAFYSVALLCCLTTAAAADPASGTNVFAPHSTPARSILHLSTFVLTITGLIFVVVFTLLLYSLSKFRARSADANTEPAQVYGSTQIELAWTIIPVLIVVVGVSPKRFLCIARAGRSQWALQTGDIRYWSEEYFRVLGFDPGSSLPKLDEFLTRVHPEDRPIVKERFEQAVREKNNFELEYRLVHPAAGALAADVSCIPGDSAIA